MARPLSQSECVRRLAMTVRTMRAEGQIKPKPSVLAVVGAYVFARFLRAETGQSLATLMGQDRRTAERVRKVMLAACKRAGVPVPSATGVSQDRAHVTGSSLQSQDEETELTGVRGAARSAPVLNQAARAAAASTLYKCGLSDAQVRACMARVHKQWSRYHTTVMVPLPWAIRVAVESASLEDWLVDDRDVPVAALAQRFTAHFGGSSRGSRGA